MNFTFSLLNNKEPQLYKIARIWFWVLLILLIASSYLIAFPNHWLKFSIRIATLVAWYFLDRFLVRTKKHLNYLWLFLTAISAIFCYFTAGIFFALLIFGFCVFIWFFMQQNTVIAFSKEQVLITSFLQKKNIAWQDLSNVVLKDQLLTLDFKSNKIFQQEIATAENESEFNNFAQSQLTMATV